MSPLSNAERQRHYRPRQRKDIKQLEKRLEDCIRACERLEREHKADFKLFARVARRMRRVAGGGNADAMVAFTALIERWPELLPQIKRQLDRVKDAESIEALMRSAGNGS
jgi:hypothetical protein